MLLARAMLLSWTLVSAFTASPPRGDEEAFNEVPTEVAEEIERRLQAEEDVVIVDLLRGSRGLIRDNRRLDVFSDLVASLETKHGDRWLTLCFLPLGVPTIDRLAASEQRRPCAKFPVWLGEEWAPSRTRSTLLTEAMQRLRRSEVHLLNVAGSFCGYAVILELLAARVFPRTVVFNPGRGFEHCAREIMDAAGSVFGFPADFEDFLLSLGYFPDPMNELLDDAGVPLAMLTAAEPSRFLQASTNLRIRADVPCQSLSARDELRDYAEFDLSFPCVGSDGGKLSSRVRVYADEDMSVAVDRLWKSLPRVCKNSALDIAVIDNDKSAIVDSLHSNFWVRLTRGSTESLQVNKDHICRWSAVLSRSVGATLASWDLVRQVNSLVKHQGILQHFLGSGGYGGMKLTPSMARYTLSRDAMTKWTVESMLEVLRQTGDDLGSRGSGAQFVQDYLAAGYSIDKKTFERVLAELLTGPAAASGPMRAFSPWSG
jgi:hypothetical protein